MAGRPRIVIDEAECRALYADGWSQMKLASFYSVSASVIRDRVRGVTRRVIPRSGPPEREPSLVTVCVRCGKQISALCEECQRNG